eukprot:419962-Pyramimonas_sp.AAC.1
MSIPLPNRDRGAWGGNARPPTRHPPLAVPPWEAAMPPRSPTPSPSFAFGDSRGGGVHRAMLTLIRPRRTPP